MNMATRPFDAANYIEAAADQADLLSDAVDSGDPRYIAYALGAVARARGGIAKLAREAGMSRQALHKALSEDGNPTLDTVLKVLRALGLQMKIEEAPGGAIWRPRNKLGSRAGPHDDSAAMDRGAAIQAEALPELDSVGNASEHNTNI